MIISPTHKFIFFKPIKCAGSSIEFALSRMCSSVDLLTGGTDEEELMGFFSQNNHFTENQVVFMRFHSHTTPDMLLKRSAQDENVWTDFYKITVVRNPWDLLVSGYWYMMAEMNLDLKEREYVLISGKDKLSTIKKKFKRKRNSIISSTFGKFSLKMEKN